ncbi:hypothetical protein [Rhodococcoides fascians]|uniref:hypothetical protein n=1 Tax=Rhodococcoides fascians TaxID=1828 RepID=UPI00050BFA6C|nr:hypothetical protein [Rhodococcus fascians]
MIRQFDTVEPLPRSAIECEARSFAGEDCGLEAFHEGDVHAVVSMSGLVLATFPRRQCERMTCGRLDCDLCVYNY